MFYVNFRTSRTLFYKKFEVNVSNIPRERFFGVTVEQQLIHLEYHHLIQEHDIT